MRLSVVEGVAYAGMVGMGEFWFLADAVRQGAGPLAMAALVTVPQLVGATGAFGMLARMRGARDRRSLVVAAVVLQALGLLSLGGLSAAGWSSPTLLVLASALHQLWGQAAGTAWSSWFGEVVPARVRGRWFARRNRYVHGTTFGGIVLGGMLLQIVEPGAALAAAGLASGGHGYAILYSAAGLLRLVSASLLARSWEPPYEPPARTDAVGTVLRGPEAAGARGVVGVGAAMLLAVCLASPFFAPHMLGTLGFTYAMYIGAQGALVLAKIGSLPFWGRLIDRRGAVPVYRVASLLIALVPVPWIFADRAWIVFVAQGLSGVAWAGHEVAILTLTLAAVPGRRRAVLLTAQSLMNGGAQLVGGLAGGSLSQAFSGLHAVAFGASALARLCVALSAPFALAALRRLPLTGVPAARVVGWRPHGGVMRLPISTDPPPEEE